MTAKCLVVLILLLIACNDSGEGPPDSGGPDHYDCGYFRWCVDGVVYQKGPTSQSSSCTPDCTGEGESIFTCAAGCATSECEWTCDVSILETCGDVGDGSNLCAPPALTDGSGTAP